MSRKSIKKIDFCVTKHYIVFILVFFWRQNMATMSIRTNDERKQSFEGFCESIGITVTSAVNMFITAWADYLSLQSDKKLLKKFFQ